MRDGDWVIPAMFVLLVAIITLPLVYLASLEEDTARECIKAGFQWIDDSCVRKG
jgi:hypothetical protein